MIPVHLYGYPADMAGLQAAAPGIPIVEDAAQAIGACYGGSPVGSFGIGCFSLYATKNVTAGEGGVVTCNDDEVADRIRLLRNQGSRRRYEYEAVGQNYRLTELQAALANPQLDRLDQIIERRRANAAELTAGLRSLPGIRVPIPDTRRQHVYHLYTIVVGDQASRDELAASLARAGIETGVVYPKLLHAYPCYAEHPRVVADPTPVAADLTRRVLALPVHPGLGPDDPATIVAAVRRILGH
jgi:dTDP-4-amino-4,6-dideoxygalactose transaminase